MMLSKKAIATTSRNVRKWKRGGMGVILELLDVDGRHVGWLEPQHGDDLYERTQQ